MYLVLFPHKQLSVVHGPEAYYAASLIIKLNVNSFDVLKDRHGEATQSLPLSDLHQFLEDRIAAGLEVVTSNDVTPRSQ